ncbi:RE1 [Symbiodinium sp. CCMP2592]|nr:RE1 [Symbiodinium sp. CCMP2592]
MPNHASYGPNDGPTMSATTTPDGDAAVRGDDEFDDVGGDVIELPAGDDQWNDSSWSRWGDRESQSWGSDRAQYGQRWDTDASIGWGRRASWDATTATTGAAADRWSNSSEDPWSHGRDPWTGARDDDWQARDHGWPGAQGDTWADGRVGRFQEGDHVDRGSGAWGEGRVFEEKGLAWNGWSHYDNGGFQGHRGDHGGYSGGGRASEKLAIPTFTGEDTEDVGGSARSYLRQIEAWRRMTLLPASQQGLVLYQNLGGKAWIAAEELSVPRLGSSDGVSYFVAWINARFLDLEVARIGKAFSDFFRRLKRRAGQSIREYNTEYDRLHARLREVGCSIPQECAAWLYIDRLQLEEAQELNLLASVGNEYNLHRLQQAAVLHDRGHRKPWENGRARKPHTAHFTAGGDGGSGDEDLGPTEDIELEDGVPEDVAVAYATYQSAKEKYKEQTKARGYQGDRGPPTAKDGNARKSELSREEKVKLMKARSFCGSCGKKGHWHRDPVCPNYATSAQGAAKTAPKEVEMCHHVPAEVFSLKHDGAALLGITDTACAKAVAGTMWLQQYSDALKLIGQSPELIRESEAFRFGTGKVHHSSFHVLIRFRLGNRTVEMKTSIINGDVPLLMSKPALAQLGMVYDVAENRADFTKVGLRNFDLVTTSSGHPAIPIIPAKPEHGQESRLRPQSISGSAIVMKAPSRCSGLAEPLSRKCDLARRPFPRRLRSEMACSKPPAISKMTKVELLSECNRVGLVVHRNWTCEEIKATIMEHRMNDPQQQQASVMKSVTSLTLAELKEKADQLGVQYPSQVTKGNLIRLIRDSTKTPGTELMKIGKFKGYEYQEVPRSYGMWAAREIRMSPNPHVELVRFAQWWEAKEYETHYGDRGTIEENATVPYPLDTSSVADLPHDPRNSKRGNPYGDLPEMEAETDPATLEEIRALETRLAVLKQKAKASSAPPKVGASDYMKENAKGTTDLIVHYLMKKDTSFDFGRILMIFVKTDKDNMSTAATILAEFERGIVDSTVNFACQTATKQHRDEFTAALLNKDFDFHTLGKLLDTLDYDPVKATRDGVFGGKTGDKVNYFTYGMFTHGGVVGTTTKTREHDNVARYLNGFARHHLGDKATWSSVSLSRNTGTEVHHDFNNLKGTANFTVSLGQTKGGGLWIEDRSVTENDTYGVKWRRTGTGQWLPGRIYDTKNKFVEFDPFLKHGTEAWSGNRWSVTYHTTRNLYKAGDEMKKFLRKCGFPLPKGTGRSTGEAKLGNKPRASVRRSIFNNAARISVMMATLISAAGNYLAEHVHPQVQRNPVVLFEIGDTESTQQAAELGKDVFEPMTWERYRSPEGKTDAFHIVNGGTPRELRLHLDGKSTECDEAILELMKQQVNDGGTVVLSGKPGDTLFEHIDKDPGLLGCKQHGYEDGLKVFMVFFKDKETTQRVKGPGRVHEVKVVSSEEPGQDNEALAMGATGISFGKDTPRPVATALRRLHQNLGHPRQEDLIRHLRLAGCDQSVLKAARSMRCQVCEANAAPKIARPSTIPPMADFNDTLGLDLFFCHDTDDVKHAFLSVVHYGTTYHTVVKLDGQSGEDIEAKFNEMWLIPFGPPKAVVIDLEGGLQSALGRVCDWHGIGVRSVATQSHWQAGVVERQQAWWKHIWQKISYQLSIGEDEVNVAVPIISSAKNDLRRRCGYSPSQWVFGKAPRVPEDLQDPDGGGHVMWDVSEDAKYQRQSAMRAAARVAFHESQTDGRLRKALLQRTRVAARPLDVGESVHFWHKPKNRRQGCWSGPAVIVGKEGGNYWISKGGRCRLTSAEHLRPTTGEEVGALLAMKGTQKEAEMLLNHDPDGDEAFEEDLEELMRDIDEEMSWAGDEADQPVDDLEMEGDLELEPLREQDAAPVPKRRLKRKTTAAELNPDRHEAMMLKTHLTTRGLEKRKEKELKWSEIPAEVHEKFREAEATQWNEHLSFDALQPLSVAESDRVRREVPAERILRSRWAYKDKNWARRREGEDVPWKCKSRLVIAGHTDPDLTDENLRLNTDAPTLSRSGLACMLQRTADGLVEDDPWTLAAGDIRCAFLTGSYLSRELYMHQPKTGFPGLLPGQLVKIQKNVFGLATSPHTWWQDLQNGINEVEIKIPEDTDAYRFEPSAMDPCVFALRKWDGEKFYGIPVAYLGCHVDDLLIAGPRKLQQIIQQALAGKFEIQTWEADDFEFLGSRIVVATDRIKMTQEKYAETRLFTIEVPAGIDDSEAAPQELSSDNRSLIGALSWMSAQTRPDLTCSVSMAQQLQKAPTYGDIKFTNAIATKAYQYRERGLEFKPIPKGNLMILVFHDAAWANVPEADPEEDYYVLTQQENIDGLQTEGPYANGCVRKAKKGNSKVASQLGILVMFADRAALAGQAGNANVADWKSRAGQRVCRSTFGAETQACAEGLETGQYVRSMYETLLKGVMTAVDAAELPILCLSDCRSLYDHLNKQGIPRVPSDKRLAVDLAALRQGLRSEKWNDSLPIAWIPGALQKGDVLTKPQNPSDWWDSISTKLLLPLAIGQEGVLISNRTVRQRTSVKLDGTVMLGSIFPFEYFIV